MSLPNIIDSKGFVLVDFYADWCEPCKWVEPIVDEVIENFQGKIILQKIDIDMQPNIARDRLILSVPTLVLYKNGKEIWRMRGFDTAPVLIKILNGLMTPDE
jgi:thioredoxin 1